MGYILYRNEKILTMTLPKNMLLFRFAQKPEDDFHGVELEDGKHCLTPTYNVFFYASPFVNKLSLPQHTKEKQIHVYLLNHDVEVVQLFKPSKYTRGHRHAKRAFIKNCNKTKRLCLPRQARQSDPCFTETVIKKYPKLGGLVGFPIVDARMLQRKIEENKISKSNLKYIKFVEDANGVKSAPEIVLHPLTKRPSGELITTKEDKLDNNYRILTTLSVENAELKKFMEDHAVNNPDTFFYTYKE